MFVLVLNEVTARGCARIAPLFTSAVSKKGRSLLLNMLFCREHFRSNHSRGIQTAEYLQEVAEGAEKDPPHLISSLRSLRPPVKTALVWSHLVAAAPRWVIRGLWIKADRRSVM